MRIARVNNSITKKVHQCNNGVTVSQLTVDFNEWGKKNTNKKIHNSNKIFMNRNENTEKNRTSEQGDKTIFCLLLCSFDWRHHVIIFAGYQIEKVLNNSFVFVCFERTIQLYWGVIYCHFHYIVVDTYWNEK